MKNRVLFVLMSLIIGIGALSAEEYVAGWEIVQVGNMDKGDLYEPTRSVALLEVEDNNITLHYVILGGKYNGERKYKLKDFECKGSDGEGDDLKAIYTAHFYGAPGEVMILVPQSGKGVNMMSFFDGAQPEITLVGVLENSDMAMQMLCLGLACEPEYKNQGTSLMETYSTIKYWVNQ